MGKTYPLDYPLVKKDTQGRSTFLIYALPFTVIEITMGRSRRNFYGKLT